MKTPLSGQMPSVEAVAKGCQFCCEEKSNTSKTTSVPDQQDAAVNAVVWDFGARALHAMVSRARTEHGGKYKQYSQEEVRSDRSSTPRHEKQSAKTAECEEALFATRFHASNC